MKMKLTKNHFKTYLKLGYKEEMDAYNRVDHISAIYFYADKETEGINQMCDRLMGYDRIIYPEIEDKFRELSKNGWKNIRCEVCKNYYVQSKYTSVRLCKSMMVYEYKYR